MPQPGEIRTNPRTGETRQWDGTQFQPYSSNANTAPLPSTDHPAISLGGIPGVEDIANLPSNLVKGARALPDVMRNLFSHPGATAKGFVQGASEAATPGRLGLLALLTAGANVPSALAAAGGQAVADTARVATHASNAPQSFPEAATDVALAGAAPALGAGESALATRVGGQARLVKGAVGAGVGGYEGYKYGGVPGLLGGAVGGAALGGGKVRLPGRFGVLSDMLGGTASEADVAAPVQNPSVGVRRSWEVPGSSYRPVLEAPGSAIPGVQPTNMGSVIPNTSGFRPDIPEGAAPGESLPGLHRALSMEPYSPSESGYVRGESIPPAPGERTTFDRPTTEQLKELPLNQQMDYLPSEGGLAERPAGTPPASIEGLRRATVPLSENPSPFAPDTSDTLEGQPDLYSLATQGKGPVAAGTPWYGEKGEIIGHTTDTGGSTGLAPAHIAMDASKLSPADWSELNAFMDRSVSAQNMDALSSNASQIGLRKALANTLPVEGDNPVLSRSLTDLRAEVPDGTDLAQTDQWGRAERQAQMLRRLKGGGR